MAYSFNNFPGFQLSKFGANVPTDRLYGYNGYYPPWHPYGANDQLNSIAFRPSSEAEFMTLSNPIRAVDNQGNRALWLCFELKGFRTEEISVSLNKAERAIIIEAAHEVREGLQHHVQRKFYRKFGLPATLNKVDLTKVQLSAELDRQTGMLSVECQLPAITPEEVAYHPTMNRLYSNVPFSHFHEASNACVHWCNDSVKEIPVKMA